MKFSVNHRKGITDYLWKQISEIHWDNCEINVFISGEQIGKPKNKHLKKTDKFVPTFKKKQGESNKIFLGRVNNIVHEYLNIHKFEQKYKVDIIRDQESGEV